MHAYICYCSIWTSLTFVEWKLRHACCCGKFWRKIAIQWFTTTVWEDNITVRFRVLADSMWLHIHCKWIFRERKIFLETPTRCHGGHLFCKRYCQLDSHISARFSLFFICAVKIIVVFHSAPPDIHELHKLLDVTWCSRLACEPLGTSSRREHEIQYGRSKIFIIQYVFPPISWFNYDPIVPTPPPSTFNCRFVDLIRDCSHPTEECRGIPSERKKNAKPPIPILQAHENPAPLSNWSP